VVSAFSDVRADYAGKLAAAGVTGVTVDPAANVPMVLVDAITVTGASGVGAWAGQLPIRIVVPAPGDAGALAALEDLLEAVLVTLGGAPAAPDTYGPTELPSYTVTYPVSVNNPNC
jgi:hypothetical protein